MEGSPKKCHLAFSRTQQEGGGYKTLDITAGLIYFLPYLFQEHHEDDLRNGTD